MNTGTQDYNTNHVGNLIAQGLIQFKEDAKRYQKDRECERPEFARFKLKIWWRDGNCNVFYSYDYDYHYPDGKQVRIDDEKRGWWKLLKYLSEQKQADTFKTAVIWMSLDERPKTIISKYDYCVAKSIRPHEGKRLKELEFLNGKVDMKILRESLDKKFMCNYSNLSHTYELIKLKAA